MKPVISIRLIAISLILPLFVCRVASLQGADSICPISPMFSHGSYVTYYAKQCPLNVFRTWDDVPGLTPLANSATCCGSNPQGCKDLSNAVAVDNGKKEKALFEIWDEGYKNKGSKKILKYDDDTVGVAAGEGTKCSVIGNYYIMYQRKLGNKEAPIFAQVYIVQVSYKADPPAICAFGHEIEKRNDVQFPELVIPPDSVARLGKRYHQLTIGEIKCNVLLYKGSKPDEDE